MSSPRVVPRTVSSEPSSKVTVRTRSSSLPGSVPGIRGDRVIETGIGLPSIRKTARSIQWHRLPVIRVPWFGQKYQWSRRRSVP